MSDISLLIGKRLEQLADGLEAGAYKVDREGVLVRIGGSEDQDAEPSDAPDPVRKAGLGR